MKVFVFNKCSKLIPARFGVAPIIELLLSGDAMSDFIAPFVFCDTLCAKISCWCCCCDVTLFISSPLFADEDSPSVPIPTPLEVTNDNPGRV